jgi:hypothetical protein
MERLRSAAGVAQIGGAAGSAALMVYAAQRVHAPRALLVGFTLWVLSPFALLAFASIISKRWRWPVETRRALDFAKLFIALASLLVYGVFALGGNRPRTAPFVLVAPASWLATALVVSAVALTARKRSRRTQHSRATSQ